MSISRFPKGFNGGAEIKGFPLFDVVTGNQYFVDSGFPFVLNPGTAVSSSVLLVVAGLIGSAISIRLITRIDPIIALGTER